MNPNKLIPILAVIMCAGLSFAIWFAWVQIKADSGQSETVFILDTPTIESVDPVAFSLAPVSTPRPSSTPIDWGDLPITQTASVALAIHVSALQTEVAIQDEIGKKTATQQAVATGTALVFATEQQKATERARSDFLTQAYQISQLEQEKRLDALEVAWGYTWKVGGTIVVFFALILGLFYLQYRAKMIEYRKAIAETEDNFLDNLAPVVQVSTPNSVFEHEIVIEDKWIPNLKRAIVELNGVLSRRRMCPGYFSELVWDLIEKELLKKNADDVALATKDSRYAPTILSDAGWDYFKLTRPTPLSGDESIKNMQIPANLHSAPPHLSGEVVENGEGEGKNESD